MPGPPGEGYGWGPGRRVEEARKGVEPGAEVREGEEAGPLRWRPPAADRDVLAVDGGGGVLSARPAVATSTWGVGAPEGGSSSRWQARRSRWQYNSGDLRYRQDEGRW